MERAEGHRKPLMVGVRMRARDRMRGRGRPPETARGWGKD